MEGFAGEGVVEGGDVLLQTFVLAFHLRYSYKNVLKGVEIGVGTRLKQLR